MVKIAIQGHPTRGKEIIQILESLGGKNVEKLEGTYETFYYVDDKNEIGDDHRKNFPSTYKLYTLEEFEKEFPFKVGDKVTIITDIPYKIVALEYYMGRLCYRLDNGLNYNSKVLTLYKEMKEERNITLTLDKAKEWYKKGGELKEIALQAFTEKELTKVDLPKTWEEFYEQYKFKRTLNTCLDAIDISFSPKYVRKFKAFVKLQYLRDCWRQGWEPTPRESYYTIKFGFRGLDVYRFCTVEFLSFPTREMTEEFLECFRDLIEKAGDLI